MIDLYLVENKKPLLTCHPSETQRLARTVSAKGIGQGQAGADEQLDLVDAVHPPNQTSLTLVEPEASVGAQQGRNTVGAYEAKTHLSELLERVEAGEEITITKHGAPVAKLVPIKKEVSIEERTAAIRRIQKLSGGLSLGELKIKDLLREGRR